MKIFYDSQAFSMQKYGGVSNYFVELISGVLHSGNDICLPVSIIDNVYLKKADFLPYLNKNKNSTYSEEMWFNRLDFKGKKRVQALLEKVGILKSNIKVCKKFLQNEEFDLFHPTYYDPYFIDHLNGKPFVVTVHDMVHELYPYCFKNTELTLYKKILVERASAIIAVSQSTKNDLVRLFNIPEEKITVIYHATSFKKVLPETILPAFPERYILFTGQRRGYKNFEKFITATAPLLSFFNLHVVCTAQKFTVSELALFDKLGIQNRVVHISGDYQILAQLYSNALLFVFPSLYEGFGIPVLEAFSCGCPAVLSNTSSLPEVGGGAAEYFDPHSEESIRTAVQNVINDKAKRGDMVQKGIERAKKFSWDKMTAETINVYKNIIDT